MLVLTFSMAATALASQPLHVSLKERITVDRDVVAVADIASVSGGTLEQRDVLRQAVVANSPPPGQTRFVSVDYIRIRLRQAGIDIAGLVFEGSSDIRVFRQAATLSADEIKRAVEAAIRRHMPWKNENVTITDIQFDEELQLPTGRLTYSIEPNRNEDYLGRTMLALNLSVDGVPTRKVWVTARISVMAEVVAVVRPLGKHQKIEQADLAMVPRDLADLPSNTVRSIADVLGNRTTRMIYPDTVLEAGMFIAPPLVRRGDIVKVVVHSGPMTITATGMVKQQGAKGDLVRVVNTDSNRIITARVTGPGAVEVDF